MLTSPQLQQTHYMETGNTRTLLHIGSDDTGCFLQAKALAGEAPPALWCLPLHSQLDNKAGG